MLKHGQKTNNIIGDITPLPYHASSEAIFKVISTLNKPVWLDSGKPKSHSGRFDILSANPRKVFTYDIKCKPQSFIEQLDSYLTSQKPHIADAHQLPENPFWGGLIGSLDYAFKHSHFNIKHASQIESTTQVGFYDWAVIQDHKLKTCHLIFMRDVPQKTRQDIYHLLPYFKVKPHAFNRRYTISTWQYDQADTTYFAHLNRINTYIHQGDTYQVNYTQRFSTTLKGNPAAAYLTLRQTVPSPFSAYLGLNNHTILSVSPEQFVGVIPDTTKSTCPTYQAKTQPIKGTAKRSSNTIEDTKRAKDLSSSLKNQSENVMIVDLLRNDFSQNCVTNSVKTPKLFSLESYANVHHLVSTVTGTLKPNISPLVFMSDCFPGGSITGAPKKRSMEIINELEPHSRQMYCGSVFYQSICGQLDSNILIRSMLHSTQAQSLYCWGGGGIIADSDPKDEYQESIDKVEKLMKNL